MRWIGVAEYPRVIQEQGDKRVYQLPQDCSEWKTYLENAYDPEGRRPSKITNINRFDHISIPELSPNKAIMLIRMIAQYWSQYYSTKKEIEAFGRWPRETNDRKWQVKAKWWWEVSEVLSLPMSDNTFGLLPMMRCWLPDKRTEKLIGDLLPVIDLNPFLGDKEIVQKWLIAAFGIRRQAEQITVEEWKEILSAQIPRRVPVKNIAGEGKLYNKVYRWYEVCLEIVHENMKDIPQNVFKTCPLLCRKSESWGYVNGDKEKIFLDSDNDYAKAFANEVWLIQDLPKLNPAIKKYFGVLSLSESVNEKVLVGDPRTPLTNELREALINSLPFIWAWRSSHSKQNYDKLKELKVCIVPLLTAQLELNDIHREKEREWYVSDNTIILHQDHVNEFKLAQALANALEIKSDEEFYENLLRCHNNEQRKEKILSRNVLSEEVLTRLLSEYSGSSQEEEEIAESVTIDTEEETRSTFHPVSPKDKESQEPINKEKQQYQSLEESSEHKDVKKEILRLKDAKTVDYGDGQVQQAYNATSVKRESKEVTGQKVSPLSEFEKSDLEEAGRQIAKRELENMGYNVVEKSQTNPGYDLLATKDGKEMHIEVKAHAGRATTVELTKREYEEYLNSKGYRWELWNIEHLAELDSHKVTYTRFINIPAEALSNKAYYVDLKKCRQQNP